MSTNGSIDIDTIMFQANKRKFKVAFCDNICVSRLVISNVKNQDSDRRSTKLLMREE